MREERGERGREVYLFSTLCLRDLEDALISLL
jgi:hypothetical protein